MPGGHLNTPGSGKNTSGQAKHHESQDSRLSKSKKVTGGIPSLDSLAELDESERLALIKGLMGVWKGQENRDREKKLERVKAGVTRAIAERDALETGESSKNARDKTITASTSPKPSASTPAAATSKDSGANADTTEKKKKKKKSSKGKKKPDQNAAQSRTPRSSSVDSTRSRPQSQKPATRK